MCNLDLQIVILDVKVIPKFQSFGEIKSKLHTMLVKFSYNRILVKLYNNVFQLYTNTLDMRYDLYA